MDIDSQILNQAGVIRLPIFNIIYAHVIRGIEQLEDESVDMICTSPPYWAQRNYQVPGQIGHEPTSQEFVDKLVYIFYDKCYRVLKPHGLIFLNLGDSYNGSGGQGSQGDSKQGVLDKSDVAYKARDLMNIPHRVYSGLRDKGYYWRSTVIWSKLNGMPESVKGVRWERHKVKVGNAGRGTEPWRAETGQQDHDEEGNFKSDAIWEDCKGCDKCTPNNGYVLKWGSGRPTSKYETIGILTKDEYYWDTEAVRTVYAASSTPKRFRNKFGSPDGSLSRMPRNTDHTEPILEFSGASLGNIWEMPTAMFSEKHFATFPEQLPEICIKAGSSAFGCCSECGRPYARILERVVGEQKNDRHADGSGYDNRRKPTDIYKQSLSTVLKTVGWKATCEHVDKEVVPSVVLDVFNGAGTTGLVANRLGRDYIGIDLNPSYVEMSEKRITADAPLFAFANAQLQLPETEA